MDQKRRIIMRSFLLGTGACIGLLLFYFLLVGLVESWSHATELIIKDAFFAGAISLGFGIQIGLFSYIKQLQKLVRTRSVTAMAASGTGTSTVSMVACCLHHLGDVLPIIGLSGASLFLEQYRYPLMWVGIAFNLVGIFILLRIVNKNRLWPKYVFAD
ncbi:hypothetical protein [Calderihabitans maritimus]|uniref:Uncharacterized protein n=1 Tax=Calderihabitans maritimus TaxID=1246530 RepID=A0A1Z5HQZ2_9FIRM|nr:hypothetical protein [Calderihabitans maritimus]GAW91952.1 hypothetical protein Moth_1992 [Calderihabitans maritimus]